MRRSESYVFLDDQTCRIVFEFWCRRVFLHCEPRDIGPIVARRALELRADVARILGALGYRRVEVAFRENKPLQRLCRRLGFVTWRQRCGWVFMEAENACASGS